MSKRLRRLYHWLRDCFAGLLIASTWGGLWLLWPTSPPERTAPRSPPDTVVSYTRLTPDDHLLLHAMPDRFTRTATAGVGIPDRLGMMWDAPELTLPPPDMLERSGENTYVRTDDLFDRVAHRTEEESKPYEPADSQGPVFPRMGRPPSGLHVEASPNLDERGFHLPKLDIPEKWATHPWMVRAYLDVTAAGRVENVLLETACEDPDVNAMLVRHLKSGRVDNGGTAVSGRVTISFYP